MASRLRGWLERGGKQAERVAGEGWQACKLKQEGGTFYVGFVDFRTIFDSVDRGRLIERLKEKGVRGKLGRMIEVIYRETRNEIITGEGITEEFATERGVRQGCSLSPTLFNVYLDDLEEQWVRKGLGGTVIGGKKIHCLKFADDVADTGEGLREIFQELEKYSEKSGLRVNIQKTKVMVFRKGGGGKNRINGA
ncbi:hypothetical protein M0802_011929 [Mischocyttarus mexicanus]|nr:hypothetical protein M0802_011929 [Mischocyttarus mexicanus]